MEFNTKITLKSLCYGLFCRENAPLYLASLLIAGMGATFSYNQSILAGIGLLFLGLLSCVLLFIAAVDSYWSATEDGTENSLEYCFSDQGSNGGLLWSAEDDRMFHTTMGSSIFDFDDESYFDSRRRFNVDGTPMNGIVDINGNFYGASNFGTGADSTSSFDSFGGFESFGSSSGGMHDY